MAWHVKYDTIKPTTPGITYYHNIGQIPDIFIISMGKPGPDNAILVGGGYSNRLLTLFKETYGSDYCNFPLTGYTTTPQGVAPFTYTSDKPIDSDGIANVAVLPARDCDTEKITLGTNTPSNTIPVNYPLAYDSSGSYIYNISIIWNDGEIDGECPVTPTRLYSPMRRGGYQILDFKNHDFTIDESYKIDGAYKLLQETRKVIMVSGLKINGTEFDSSMTSFSLIDFKFVSKYNDFYIIIEDNDNVTITETPVQQTIFINEEDDL